MIVGTPLLWLIAVALLLMLLMVLLLTIYLVDRVNSIERTAMEAVRGLSNMQGQGSSPPGPFGNLHGKELWDAMTGDGAALDPMEDSMLRQRYELVLSRHIEGLFEDGRKDGQAGKVQRPQSTRRVNTIRGAVDSWLPSDVALLLYQCGQDFATKGPGQWSVIRGVLDSTSRDLYAKARLDVRGRLSDSLMGPDPDAAAPEPVMVSPPSGPAGSGT